MRAAGFRDHPENYARYLADQSVRQELGRADSSIDVVELPSSFAGKLLGKVSPAYEMVTIASFDGKKWTIETPSDEYNKMAVKVTEENLLAGAEQLAEILWGIWPKNYY